MYLKAMLLLTCAVIAILNGAGLGGVARAESKPAKPAPIECDARFGHHLATIKRGKIFKYYFAQVPSVDPVKREVLCVTKRDVGRLWNGVTFHDTEVHFATNNGLKDFPITNCANLYAIGPNAYPPGNKLSPSPAPREISRVCLLLSDLKHARPPKRTYLSSPIGLALIRRLRAEHLPGYTHIYNRPKKGNFDVTALEKKGIVNFEAGPPTHISYIALEDEEWGTWIHVFEIARSDIDRDGIQDVALLVTNYHTKASGARNFLIWLTVRKKGGQPEIIDETKYQPAPKD